MPELTPLSRDTTARPDGMTPRSEARTKRTADGSRATRQDLSTVESKPYGRGGYSISDALVRLAPATCQGVPEHERRTSPNPQDRSSPDRRIAGPPPAASPNIARMVRAVDSW